MAAHVVVEKAGTLRSFRNEVGGTCSRRKGLKISLGTLRWRKWRTVKYVELSQKAQRPIASIWKGIRVCLPGLADPLLQSILPSVLYHPAVVAELKEG